MNRRISWQARAVLLAGCPCVPLTTHPQARAASEPTSTPTLREAYARAFKLGVAVNQEIIAGEDPRSRALVLEHFNALTAESVMKAAGARQPR
jgi:endo-1,4-beta-xylanase